MNTNTPGRRRGLLPALALATGLLLAAASAHAIGLDEAKAKGLVGETPTGYLAAVSAPSPEVKQLIDSINGQRKAQYEAIAKKHGTDLKAVEALAGKKAIEKTPKGQKVLVGGQWTTK